MFLNVCGLKSKLKFQEFNDIVQKYDVCFLVESKLDDLDIIEVPNGYTYVTKNRKKMAKKSGGIVIIYKKNIEKNLSIIESNSQFVQWLKISKHGGNIQENILIGCVYVPPEGSKYSNIEAFDEIENEMVNLLKESKMHYALVGDFNAKTGTLKDFIVPDESILDLFHLDTDDDIISYMEDYKNLQSYDIPLDRITQCTCQPNSYGFKLLNLCKKLNLYIANSRVGFDRGIGKKLVKIQVLLIILYLLQVYFLIYKSLI